ncbi:MAG TPA: 3-keto-5-aminohexanoate cleavage protein, partial [Stellaceae bacterium]|nr:3-keto-5-aminohexanoate cleavage protein [Stellaceae bacterium]
ELFDSGDIHLMLDFMAEGVLKRPALVSLVLGVKYGFPATPATMAYARSLLPSDCHWASFGIGRMMYPMLAQAYVLGGHVRVGLEDGVMISRGKLAPSNAALVEKAKRIVEDLGGELATPNEARDILGLKKR